MAEAAPPYPLEPAGRLSRSRLWHLQRRFFEQRGIAAWGSGQVPHWIANNPYVAEAYGRVLAAFLRDWRGALDPAEPVYIVELGAGAGRLAFHLLRWLERAGLADAGGPRGVSPRIIYVMTDFAEANLAAWRAHPQLQPWLEAGRLDLARFDAERDAAISLERSGATLAPGAVRNPIAVLANYVFDSLPLDGFSVRDGHLHEWAVHLSSPAPEPDPDDPDILRRAQLAYEQRPLPAGPCAYYGDDALDGLLEEHRALPDTAFTFPAASLACLDRLAAIAGGRMLVLSTDKGEVRAETLAGQTGLDITIHGSFSIAVNYHAIARATERRGGTALVPLEPPHRVATCAFLLGAPPAGWAETRRAYAEAIAVRSPDDFYTLKQGVARAYGALSLEELVAFLRFSGCDPKVAAECLPALAQQAPGAPAPARAALLGALERAWDAYFHIGEPYDLGFALGMLASALDAWPAAIRFFEGSLRWYGADTGTLFNLAACHRELGQLDAAQARLAEALVIDPSCEPARALAAALAAPRG